MVVGAGVNVVFEDIDLVAVVVVNEVVVVVVVVTKASFDRSNSS